MNKADRHRFVAIMEIGCLACRLQFPDKSIDFSYTTDVHHILNGGRRQSHQHTIGLCPWHHRGIIVDGAIPRELMMDSKGPSLAHSRRIFENHFLPQDELLEWQNELIGEMEAPLNDSG